MGFRSRVDYRRKKIRIRRGIGWFSGEEIVDVWVRCCWIGIFLYRGIEWRRDRWGIWDN